MSTILHVGSLAPGYFSWAVKDVVLEASCPMAAVDLCRIHRDVDLLVADVDLGLVSGMELASLLRAWIPNLRTVLLSDAPLELWSDRQAGELNELSPDFFLILRKPFTLTELKESVTRLAPVAA